MDKRKDLIALYSQVKHRAPLEFEIDSNVDAANNDEENINQLNPLQCLKFRQFFVPNNTCRK